MDYVTSGLSDETGHIPANYDRAQPPYLFAIITTGDETTRSSKVTSKIPGLMHIEELCLIHCPCFDEDQGGGCSIILG